MSGFGSYGNQGSAHDVPGRPTMGERIKEAIPGTEEYRMKHNEGMGMGGQHHTHHHQGAGVGGLGGMGDDYGTGAHGGNAYNTGSGMGGGYGTGGLGADAEGYGTRGMGGHQHHHGGMGGMMEDAAAGSRRDGSSAYNPGADMTGANHSSYGPGQRIKESIPGTREHEAAYGNRQGHRDLGDTLMSNIPGTDAHRQQMGMNPTHNNTSGMGTMGTEHNTWAGTRDTHHAHDDTRHATGLGMSPATGTGYSEGGRETLGHKIKKHMPGTPEHVAYEADKIHTGRV